jgi:hypothetical protein
MENKPKRGRPPGAINKEKFTLVSLDQLNGILKGNVCIPVKAEFASSLLGLGLVPEKSSSDEIEDIEDTEIEDTEDVEDTESSHTAIPVNVFNFGGGD